MLFFHIKNKSSFFFTNISFSSHYYFRQCIAYKELQIQDIYHPAFMQTTAVHICSTDSLTKLHIPVIVHTQPYSSTVIITLVTQSTTHIHIITKPTLLSKALAHNHGKQMSIYISQLFLVSRQCNIYQTRER